MTRYTEDKPSHFYMMGISYQKANEQQRGKFTIFPDQLDEIKRIAADNQVTDFFLLSTCNRTEIYAFAHCERDLLRLFAQATTQAIETLNPLVSFAKDAQAIQHICRVGAGLESQIVGDFEIIGQLKTWFVRCKKLQTTNAFLERLVALAIQISKRVKNETVLSSGTASVSFAAVNYILRTVENPTDKRITLFGTGKIGQNTCDNLIKHTQHRQLSLVNRDFEKAQHLGKKYDVDVYTLDHLTSRIAASDILIVATGAPEQTVRKEHISSQKNLLIIDLSVPSNVSSEVSTLPGVTVVGVDTLSTIVQQHITKRQSAIPQAEQIIQEKIAEFNLWLDSRTYAPFLQSFRTRLENIHHWQELQLQKKTEIYEPHSSLNLRVIQKLTNHLAVYLKENENEAKSTMQMIDDVFKISTY